jgi:hypothetical protein
MSDEIENGQDDTNQIDEALEAEAREMGWVPEDEFHGNKEKWTPAAEWVERGKNILPILQANNKRLKKDLLTRDEKIANLERAISDSQKAVAALQKSYEERTKQEVDKAKRELREQIKLAREVGDTDTELDLQDRLDDLKQSEATAKKDQEAQSNQNENDWRKQYPELAKWQTENPWYGDLTDPDNRKRTRTINRIMEDMRDDGDTTSGTEFLNKALSVLEEREEGSGSKKATSTKPVNRVEGTSSGRSARGGRLFDRLSKEAKAIAAEQAEDFVGPGKMFKTKAEWEDYFAEQVGEE